jgi:hypothetical protein
MRPISEAPKDGTILLAYWYDTPVLMAWVEQSVKMKRSGIWPFHRLVPDVREAGWYILLLNRNGQYVIHGNFKPFQPDCFAYLPERLEYAD